MIEKLYCSIGAIVVFNCELFVQLGCLSARPPQSVPASTAPYGWSARLSVIVEVQGIPQSWAEDTLAMAIPYGRGDGGDSLWARIGGAPSDGHLTHRRVTGKRAHGTEAVGLVETLGSGAGEDTHTHATGYHVAYGLQGTAL